MRSNKSTISNREAQAKRMKEKRTAERDIGPIPNPISPERRKSTEHDLELFKKTYFPDIFYRPSCEAQLKITQDIQSIIINGGKKAEALPRGMGKSSEVEVSVLWATLNGHRKFIVPVCDTIRESNKMLENLKMYLLTNELLFEDFPEICYPIRALDQIAHRAKGQLSQGESTYIVWSRENIRFPCIDGYPGYGAIIWTMSMEKPQRGLNMTMPNGKKWRPDMLILDDPQNRESAKSNMQTNERERIISADLLGLSGQDDEIAAIGTFTVIKENDLADRFLSNKLHPEWRGVRHSLIKTWPDENAMDLWQEYRNIYLDELATFTPENEGDCKHPQANDFYINNRDLMDSGSEVISEFLQYKNEVSSIQNAMNKFFTMGEDAFMSEQQNMPIKQNSNLYSLSMTDIMRQLNGFENRETPDNTILKVAAIDINYYAASWAYGCWREGFSMFVQDYGFYPGGRDVFYDSTSPDVNEEVGIMRGLDNFIPQLRDRLPDLEVLGIDGNRFTAPVTKWIEAHQHEYSFRFVVLRGMSPKQYKVPQSGERKKRLLSHKEQNYTIIRSGKMRENWFDSSFWHMVMQKMWLLPAASMGSASLFGTTGINHREYAEQITNERLIDYYLDQNKPTYKWETNGKNEMSDVTTMLCVLANMEGLEIDGKVNKRQKKKRHKKAHITKIKI